MSLTLSVTEMKTTSLLVITIHEHDHDAPLLYPHQPEVALFFEVMTTLPKNLPASSDTLDHAC